MKRFSLQCAVFAGLMVAVGLATFVNGDGKTGKSAVKAAAPPFRLAIVDTAYILKNYLKYEDLQQEVRDAAEQAQQKAKGMIDQARTIQEQLQTGEIDQDSEEFLKKERQIISLSSKLEVYNALAKKEIKKKDVATLAKVYEDVQQAMALYAEQNGYTMIMRFTRDFEGIDEKQRTANILNQNIVRHEGADDITDSVLAWLNQQYEAKQTATVRKSAPAAKAPPVTTTSAASPAAKPSAARKPAAGNKATR